MKGKLERGFEGELEGGLHYLMGGKIVVIILCCKLKDKARGRGIFIIASRICLPTMIKITLLLLDIMTWFFRGKIHGPGSFNRIIPVTIIGSDHVKKKFKLEQALQAP